MTVEAVFLRDEVDRIRHIFASGQGIHLAIKGTSMLPLLREGLDSVYLIAAQQVRRGDIILFIRLSGDVVLHRAIKVDSQGATCCGDHQLMLESDITNDRILGKVMTISRNGRMISVSNMIYWIYTRLICHSLWRRILICLNRKR